MWLRWLLYGHLKFSERNWNLWFPKGFVFFTPYKVAPWCKCESRRRNFSLCCCTCDEENFRRTWRRKGTPSFLLRNPKCPSVHLMAHTDLRRWRASCVYLSELKCIKCKLWVVAHQVRKYSGVILCRRRHTMLSHACLTPKVLSQDLSQQLGKSWAVAELCPNLVPRGHLTCPYLWAASDTSEFSVFPHSIAWQIRMDGQQTGWPWQAQGKEGHMYRQSLKGMTI